MIGADNTDDLGSAQQDDGLQNKPMVGGSGTKSVSSKPNFFSVGKKPGGAFAKPAFKMMGGASKKMGPGASGAPNMISKGPTLGGGGPPKITLSKRQDDIEQLNGEQEPIGAPPDR